MKMLKSKKKVIALIGAAALSLSVFTPVAYADTITKNIKAIFNNIKVSYNGEIKNLSTQPFIVDGTTYVPLRAVAEIMGCNVQWANNTVYITANTAASQELVNQLALKTAEANALKVQLQQAQEELQKYKNAENQEKQKAGSLKETLAQIKDDYADEYRIEWSFDLQEKSKGLVLTVSYDARYDGSAFDRLTSSQLKSFISEMCEDIRANHKNIEITGTIKDSRSNVTKANFTYSKSDRLSFDLISALYDDFAYDLSRTYRSFSRLTNADTGDNFDLSIDDIKLSESNGNVTFTVEVSLNTATLKTNWNALSSSSRDKIEDVLYDILRDIEREFDVNADGQIKDTRSGNTIATYDGSRLKLYSVN